jgi:hypothetical protein
MSTSSSISSPSHESRTGVLRRATFGAIALSVLAVACTQAVEAPAERTGTGSQASGSAAPSCAFAQSGTNPNSIIVSCTPDPAGDPIVILEQGSANGSETWQPIFDYPASGPTGYTLMSNVNWQAVDTTFVGCSDPPGVGDGNFAPGDGYCAAQPTTVFPSLSTSPPPACTPSCGQARCGIQSDGCGGTLSCGVCAAGSTCEGGGCVCTTTACEAAACAESGGIWTGGGCKYLKCFGKICE